MSTYLDVNSREAKTPISPFIFSLCNVYYKVVEIAAECTSDCIRRSGTTVRNNK